MKTFLLLLLLLSSASAHEPSIADATGPTLTPHVFGREDLSTDYSAMNWMCPNTEDRACSGYVRAIADALVLTGRACIPKQVNSRELRDIGEEYLYDHPDRDTVLDDNAGKLLIEAFTKKWPCVQS